MTRTHDKIAHARKLAQNGRSRSHSRDVRHPGFGCFRFATIKERVNVQIEKFKPNFKFLSRCVYIQD